MGSLLRNTGPIQREQQQDVRRNYTIATVHPVPPSEGGPDTYGTMSPRELNMAIFCQSPRDVSLTGDTTTLSTSSGHCCHEPAFRHNIPVCPNVWQRKSILPSDNPSPTCKSSPVRARCAEPDFVTLVPRGSQLVSLQDWFFHLPKQHVRNRRLVALSLYNSKSICASFSRCFPVQINS